MNIKFKLLVLINLISSFIFAQPNFCPDYLFICKDATGFSKSIGYNSNKTEYCYRWSPDNLLDNPNSPNPKINSALNSTQDFTVIITTPNGDLFKDKVTVYVYSLDLEIYSPRYKGGAMIADNEEDTKGAQTFVNLDNDDEDDKLDIDDNDVLPFDDELVKLKGKIKFYPELPTAAASKGSNALIFGNFVKLNITSGADAVQLWQAESKSISLPKPEYIIKTSELEKETSGSEPYYYFTVWAEAIKGHENPMATSFELSLVGDISEANNNCSKDKVYMTNVEIKEINWLGKGNGGTSAPFTSDVLEEIDDPSSTPTKKIKTLRVFPDGRFENGTVTASRDMVDIEIVLSTIQENAKETVYLRAFDIDDPSQDKNSGNTLIDMPNGKLILDPNDEGGAGDYEGGAGLTFDEHNDNRGAVKIGNISYKWGNIDNMESDGLFQATVTTIKTIVKDFKVSQFAGDNYQLVASNNKDFLKSFKNLDKDDGLMIKNTKIQEKDDIFAKSKILTVWRLLHLEREEMLSFLWNENEIKGEFQEFSVNTNFIRIGGIEMTYIPLDLAPIMIKLDDGSINLESGKNGRFENGTIILGENPPPGYNRLELKKIVEGNGKDFLNIKSNSLKFNNLWIKFSKNNLPDIILNLSNISIQQTGTTKKYICEVIDNNNNIFLYQNGMVSIAGGNTISFEYINNNTISVSKLFIPFTLRDDDHSPSEINLKENLISDEVKNAFIKAYLYCVDDGGGLDFGNTSNTNSIPSKINVIGNNPVMEIVKLYNEYSDSGINEGDNFWVVHLFNGWQFTTTDDGDSNTEIKTCGMTPANMNDNLIYQGGPSSMIFFEVLKEVSFNLNEVVIHEIGHQFGFRHGGEAKNGIWINTIPEHPNCGVMHLFLDSPIYKKEFIPRYLNLMRSREKSPGLN